MFANEFFFVFLNNWISFYVLSFAIETRKRKQIYTHKIVWHRTELTDFFLLHTFTKVVEIYMYKKKQGIKIWMKNKNVVQEKKNVQFFPFF